MPHLQPDLPHVRLDIGVDLPREGQLLRRQGLYLVEIRPYLRDHLRVATSTLTLGLLLGGGEMLLDQLVILAGELYRKTLGASAYRLF